MRTIKVSDWRSWEITTEAGPTTACIRKDPNTGNHYEWVSGGKRIMAKRVLAS